MSKKEQGEYKATLTDDRGQDVSTLEVSGKGKAPFFYIEVINGY